MSYTSILVPVDGSQLSYKAIEQAAKFAQSMNSKITLVQVLELDPYHAEGYFKAGHTDTFIERGLEFTHKAIAEAKQKALDLGINNVETLTLEGSSISDKIVEAAKRVNADLIIITSHGRSGISKFLLGSQTQKVLSQAEIPVLVVK